jgi:superfamily II DNA or RNA helicase
MTEPQAITVLKEAALLPDVQLQEHQKRVLKKLKEHPGNMLLYHSLGSGKTLTGIAAAEQNAQPYSAVVPAALRPNFKKEQEKFTDETLPSEVMSYSGLGRGHPVTNDGTLIFDEAHRLRNPGSKQTVQALKAVDKAKQTILLSGTPVVNDPSDFAPLMSMLTKKKIEPEEFRSRYVREQQVNPNLIRRILGYTPGVEEDIAHQDELKALLKGHVDYYAPAKPAVPVNYEDINTDMSEDQANLYHAMWNKLPWILRWKLKWQFPLNKNELTRMTSFLTGPRQVGLSTLPFQGARKNPYRAFQSSPKLQQAFSSLQETLKDDRTKALVFANFIDAGLRPYAEGLRRANIPHGVFHGGLSDIQRKQLVEDYNNGKIRVALIGPSGTEGLSFKGTQLIQQLDPYWNPIRGRQAAGRGVRYDSHWDLPEDLQKVRIQRYIARLPLGFKDRLLSTLGFDREANRLAADDYLKHLSSNKDRLNQKFLNILQEVGTDEEPQKR